MLRGMSSRWRRAFRALYRLLGVVEPVILAVHHRNGIGNLVELRLPSRVSGVPRITLVGLLRANGQLYLGHPIGDCGWTRNLAAAGGGELILRGQPPLDFRAVHLAPGPERTAVIRSTGQHPFPGNALYRLARRGILASGTYFRLEPIGDGAQNGEPAAAALRPAAAEAHP